MNKIVTYCIVLSLLSCVQHKQQLINHSSDNNKNCIITCNNEIVCYKFLYNDDYPIQVDEKRFWGYGLMSKEFAYKKVDVSFDDMVKSIKTFDKKESIKDFYYSYAFVSNCKDTIYSEYNLKRWIIKESGKSIYYEYNKSQNQTKDTLQTIGLYRYDKFFRY